MNFGRLGDGGQPTAFAGLSLPRERFRVCRRCRPDQEAHAAAFAAAGWRVLESGDEDLCEAIANALAGED